MSKLTNLLGLMIAGLQASARCPECDEVFLGDNETEVGLLLQAHVDLNHVFTLPVSDE